MVIDVRRETLDPTDGEPPSIGPNTVPSSGCWVLGIHAPLVVWWRCPRCSGLVPLVPGDDIAEDGFVDEPVHSHGNIAGRPHCTWRHSLLLLDYDPSELASKEDA